MAWRLTVITQFRGLVRLAGSNSNGQNRAGSERGNENRGSNGNRGTAENRGGNAERSSGTGAQRPTHCG